MAEVFPTLGQIGYTTSDAYYQVFRPYPDGSYRRYLKSAHKHRTVTIHLEDVDKDTHDAVTDFFNARMSSTTDFEFLLYDPDETSSVDTTGGMEVTGRHAAIFVPTSDPASIDWTRSGKCRWSADIPILLLD